jgi:5-methylcytosine-specific restriction enzyme B
MTAASDVSMHPTLVERVKSEERRLLADGSLLGDEALQRAYQVFRARFGPEVLAGLDGAALLDRMHARGPAAANSSLMYWLEFKNDDEFPGGQFGGIAGGSALKFGIYQQPQSGKWFTGTSRDISEISVDEAIEFARRQRDQLVDAADILAQADSDPGSVDFADLERRILEAAPDVSTSAWGHKYLGMVGPDLVDMFHAPRWQHYHLIRLLRVPPAGDRYAVGGEFARIARETGMPLARLCRLLVSMHGGVRRYWRVGTGPLSQPGAEWLGMRDGGYIAVGWDVGDLSDIGADQEGKDVLRGRIEHLYESKAVLSRQARQLFNFLTAFQEGDIIVAASGNTLVGIGEVAGDYYHEPGATFPNRRPVRWLDTSQWAMPDPEGKLTTVQELGKAPNRSRSSSACSSRMRRPPLHPLRPAAQPRHQSLPP